MSELLRLAERCEKAEGNDSELFYDVFRRMFPKPANVWADDKHERWTTEYRHWQEKQTIFYDFVETEAFIDAALQLVPEGWTWGVGGRGRALKFWSSMEAPDYNPDTFNGYSEENLAATPALALCAASLRARAHMEGSDG